VNNPLQIRLALLAARRTSSLFIVLWVLVVLGFAANTHAEHAPHFGFAREHVWAAFLLAVAPLLVLRAAQKVPPMRSDDVAWLATKSASNATIALSTWAGVCAPWILSTSVFAFFGDVGAPSEEQLSVATGTFEVPTGSWATSAAPLRWTATIPPPAEFESGTFEIGIGSSIGSATLILVQLRDARDEWRHVSGTRVGSRGEVSLRLHHVDAGPHELELVCADPGTRAVVLSPSGTLWRRAASRFDVGLSIGLRLVQAGAAWLALALCLACFVGGTTAACTVLALWLPPWLSDWPPSTTRWIPGGDLFEALAIVGAGRAPQMPSLHAWVGAGVAVTFALVATAFALRRWRVSR